MVHGTRWNEMNHINRKISSCAVDFDKALEKMIPLIDHNFTKVICEYSCNGAADKILGIDTKSDDSSALAEIGCDPLCSGGVSR
ncbi:hypothetical protein RRG08_026958 [Elysia crispata]|uniref:Uncharacterized protein n=1 Tax=Elysia crispata TaxID=231223 RepID=A0AAE0YS71_9GAST|nr:hypothetical protein RRG08_026958 [Elysia crispata]